MDHERFFFVYANANSIAELGLQRAAERAIGRLGDETIGAGRLAAVDVLDADEAAAADSNAANANAANANAANANTGDSSSLDFISVDSQDSGAHSADTEADMFAGLDLSALDGVWADGFGAPSVSLEGELLPPDEVRGSDAGEWHKLPTEATRGSDGNESSDGVADVRADASAGAPDALAEYLGRAYARQGSLRDRIDRHAARVDGAAIERLLAQLPPDLPPLTGRLSVSGLEAWLTDYDAGDDALNELVTTIRQLDLEKG